MAGSERIRRLNDIGRFCAGLNVDDRSDLCDLTKSKDWSLFAAKEEQRWQAFRNIEARIRSWADSQLVPRTPSTRVLFYPFGGPDILYPDIFFPSADLYILVGLENIGSAPGEETIRKMRLGAFLNNYSQALDDMFRHSYFISSDMKAELSTKTIRGVLPIFIVLLARMGKELVGVETGALNEAGEFVVMSEGQRQSAKALRLRYRNPGDGALTTLIYFSQNLSDKPLEKNQAFCAFLARNLPNCFTFIKSASYLMHNKAFSTIRSMILMFSDAVLQDDSGIMFRFFDPEVWALSLFGTYRGPVKIFKEYYETNLCEAFQGHTKPLDFRFGYDWKSNLLWAVKKNR